MRRAVFVGDLIDRGPEQSETLAVVRAMHSAGSAIVVMGNHELNALCYATPRRGASPRYVRPHTEKNREQHEAFLALGEAERTDHLEWFMTLPLWADLGGLRVVHACWHQPSIDLARQRLGGDRLATRAHVVEAGTPGGDLYEAVEVIAKGPEIDLRRLGAGEFLDKDDILRHAARARWWDDTATTLPRATVLPKDATTADGRPYTLPDTAVDPGALYLYRDPVPVVYGHYWRDGEPHELEDWTPRTACVDFSAVKGGTLVAYRWSGEAEIIRDNYHPHGREIVAPS